MPYVTFVPQAPMGESADPGIFVQGTHVPAPLVERSGIWIKTAGSAILLQQNYRLSTCDAPLWLVVDDGRLIFEHREMKVPLKKGECVVIPPHTEGCMISQAKDSRLLWLTVEGMLTEDFMREMNALNRVPAKQGMLPSMVVLIRQIVQVLVRHTGTGEASYQLGQLLWGLIAAHSGQSVATSATLSHEIARVVDALRACRYRDAFSLADMAAISRMPVETFRKRFTSELGIPPLGYLQFLKMERAKTLLRDGMSVRQTGVEIGMPDPYHFSKQFKHIVGMSPTAYLKHVGTEERRTRVGNSEMYSLTAPFAPLRQAKAVLYYCLAGFPPARAKSRSDWFDPKDRHSDQRRRQPRHECGCSQRGSLRSCARYSAYGHQARL